MSSEARYNSAMEESPSTVAFHTPITADVVGIVLHLLYHGTLVRRFGRNINDISALGDAMLFVVAYAFFLVGIVLLRKMRPSAPHWLLEQRQLAIASGILMAVTIAFVIADLSGYLDLVFTIEFGDMGNSYYFLITPAIYLFIALLYMFFQTVPMMDSAEAHNKAFISLLCTNIFIGVSTSYAAVAAQRWLSDSGKISVGVTVYLTLLLLFILPRLYYAFKTRQWHSLASFDVSLIYYAVAVALPILLL